MDINKKINSINYNTNKKLKNYNEKLDLIIMMLENNLEINISIFDYLKVNNNKIEKKIKKLDEKMKSFRLNNLNCEDIENFSEDDANYDANEDANEDANYDANEDANYDANEDTNEDANEDTNEDANEDTNEDANVDTKYDENNDLIEEINNNEIDNLILKCENIYTKKQINEISLENENKINESLKNNNKYINKTDEENINNFTYDEKNNIINNPILSDTLVNCKYKEIKEEIFDLDKNFILKCLTSNSISSDIKIFKKMYIDNVEKEYYPIRHIKKKYQYWLNNHMNDDDKDGKYIKEIIVKNISICYMKINTLENYNFDIEQFLKNQEYINNMSEQKYLDKILQKIVHIVDI